MDTQTIILTLILIATGILFILNNKNMAKSTAAFYQRIYTEANLTVMFRIVGVILILSAIIITITNL